MDENACSDEIELDIIERKSHASDPQTRYHMEFMLHLLKIMVFVLLNFYFITMDLDPSHDFLSCDS